MTRAEYEEEIVKGLNGARFGTCQELIKVFGRTDRKYFKKTILNGVDMVPGTKLYCVKDIVDKTFGG